MLSAIPILTLLISNFLKIDQIKLLQVLGLCLSIFGVVIVISKGNFEIIKNLYFNKGDLWMLIAALSWSIYSAFLKKIQLPFSQFSLIQVISTIGLIFLLPQFFMKKSRFRISIQFANSFNSVICCFFCSYRCILLLAKKLSQL